MQCQDCGHNNKSGNKYCSNCGKELLNICKKCSFSNQPGDNFCGGCGEKLLHPEGESLSRDTADSLTESIDTSPQELRQVSIIFIDIVDYTRISSERDAEEIHSILSRFFEIVDGIVHAYGGNIDKHIGDAVMGVFGAPVAHGNDPERAVRAAIEIRESMESFSSEIGLEIKVHIGIASGQVIASGLGSAAHKEYTVTGNSVNLAARLVDMADSNEIFISDAVNFAVSKIVQSENVGDVTVKGLESPVKVWRLLGVSDTHNKSERRTPLIGRDSELRQFKTIIEMCGEANSGHLLYVRGEAGIGKTRLVEELTAVAESHGFESHTGLVLDFGVGKQDVIRSLIFSLFDLKPASPQDEREKTIQLMCEDHLIDKEQEIFVNDLLDVPQNPDQYSVYVAMDNETRKKGKQKAVASLIEKLSDKRPLIIVVEDLHWADEESLAYLSPLYNVTLKNPLILILTTRIEGDPIQQIRRDASGTMKFTTIDIGPLDEEDSLKFAEGFFDESNRQAQDCVSRAGGNPLFLEQLLLSAKDKECQDVPGSVHSIVLSRLDNLSTYDKKALQASSILGQRFSLEVLRFLIGNEDYYPEELINHNLIRPFDDNFIFAHALVWESVYSSLLRKRKKQLHEKAAKWFSTRDPLLYAENLDRAENPYASKAYIEAAKLQVGSFHFEQSIQTINKGLSIATEEEDLFNLLMLKGECLREIGQPIESIEIYRKALEAAKNDLGKCKALIGIAAGMRLIDNSEEALSLLRDAENIASGTDYTKELSQIHYYCGNFYFALGRIEGCLEQHRLALEFAKQANSPESEARALSGLGDAYYSQGKMLTSMKYFEQCLDLCLKHGFGRIEVENRSMPSWISLYLNEVEKSIKYGLDALKAAVRTGQQRPQITSRLTTARTLYAMGEQDEAEEHIASGLDLVESLGTIRFKPFFNIFLARIKFERHGYQPDTIQLMKESLEICRTTGIGFIGPWVLSTTALVTEDDKTSVSLLDEGEQILKNGCVGHNQFDFYRDAMEVSWRIGNWDLLERYANALEEFIKPEPLPWAEHYIEWGRALAAHGRNPTQDTAERLKVIKKNTQAVNLHTGIPIIEMALDHKF